MIFLEARQTIEAAGGGSELEGATVLPAPAPAPAGRGGARRGKKR